MEKNKIELTGTVERLKAVTTRTGKPMATWLLKVGQDRFKCVCFGNLADSVLKCADGDKIAVTGSGSINSWKDNDEHWHNDFQVSVWTAEIAGQEIRYQKSDTGKQNKQPRRKQQAPDDRDPSRFDYTSGPF